jgi:putative NADH-flavin reductase
MNTGSLYQVKKRFWLLFPTMKTAQIYSNYRTSDQAKLVTRSHFKENNLNVTYFSPDSYIVLLEDNGNYKKVLTSEGLIGWIWFDENYNNCFEEVKTEQ